MRLRRQWSCATVLPFFILLTQCLEARADLLVAYGPAYYAPGHFLTPRVQRYSNTGADLGNVGHVTAESIDDLAVGPDGRIYAMGNTLGFNGIVQFPPDGPPISIPSAYGGPITLSRGMAVGWGSVFVVSNKGEFSGGGLTGALRFDPVTLNFLGNAIPFPDPPSSANPALHGIAFGTDDLLYLSTSSGVMRYSEDLVFNRGTQTFSTQIHKDQSFLLPAVGDIKFRPGDSSIYLRVDHAIRQYSHAGLFARTLVNSGVSDFAFGDDGYLYVSSSGVVWRHDADTGLLIDTVMPSTGSVIAFAPPIPESATLLLMSAGLILFLRRPLTQCANPS